MCTINDIETARIPPPLFKGIAGDTIDGALPPSSDRNRCDTSSMPSWDSLVGLPRSN